jgi:molybdopterin converting factor small subunit
MSIHVEFLGIARQRAGVPELDVEASSLGDACSQLCHTLPALRDTCLTDAGLLPGFLASVNGRTFTRDPNATLATGDSLLILSADAGG